VNHFDLSPERSAGQRRAETLARKINLLLDVIPTASGKPYDYPAIRDAAQEAGYYISRTRWSLLKHGKEQVVPEEALRAIATVFDVNPEYLLQEDGKLPEQVEAELELLRSLRRAEVRNFAARALGPVDPETLKAIAKILDEA
jgi:transcriptional regulator with XRE-family HTH domain